MIVERRIVKVKSGRMDEARQLLTEHDSIDRQRTMRIYFPIVAPFNQIIIEQEFEDFAECEQVWADWQASAGGKDFMRQWLALEDHGVRRELWELVG